MQDRKTSAALWALGITLVQLAFALSFSQPAPSGAEGGFTGRYLQLVNWDGFRYRDIAEKGYRIPSPPGSPITSEDIHEGRANVVFFPGYPLLGRAVSSVLGVSTGFALLLVAQFFCWAFWTYFLRFLRLREVDERTIAWSALAVAVHPAAFFLVSAYTEPLFLAGLLGFIYWIERCEAGRPEESLRFALPIAAVHSIAMSFTRIVSFALGPYPWIRSGRLGARAILLGASVTVGALVFFTYCQVTFDEWSLYFRLEEIGWQNHRRWFAIVDPRSYIPRFFFEHTVDSFNRSAVLFTAILFGLAWRFERAEPGPLPKSRLALYFSAFVLFYIPLTGKANANMDSMIRYTVPTFVLLVFCFAELHSARRAQGRAPLFGDRVRWLALAGGVFSLVVQGWFIYRYLRGRWVA